LLLGNDPLWRLWLSLNLPGTVATTITTAITADAITAALALAAAALALAAATTCASLAFAASALTLTTTAITSPAHDVRPWHLLQLHHQPV
jgi:hypothetical protein